MEPDYRNTPERDGPFDNYRTDPDMTNPVKNRDYDGLFKKPLGFARGHLAPYGVMGGDRDGDGMYASLDDQLNDPDDAFTVFESNYMSNMAPQHHYEFNGSGGLWYKVERWIQGDIVQAGGRTVWVFAGTISGPGPPEWVISEKNIVVPTMFF